MCKEPPGAVSLLVVVRVWMRARGLACEVWGCARWSGAVPCAPVAVCDGQPKPGAV